MASLVRHIAPSLAAAVLETLWPTRCALCDKPGALLCDSCRRALPYIDQMKACPRCGSPYGLIQCCDCSATMLEPLGRTEPPFDSCTSACLMDKASGHLISVFKDAGEQHLAGVLAELMLDAAEPHLLEGIQALTFIPCTRKAYLRRGFDHGELLANACAAKLHAPCLSLFERPSSADQRGLGRRERFANMKEKLALKPGRPIPASIIVIDDAYTTGATMFAAADALRAAHVDEIRCLTFART